MVKPDTIVKYCDTVDAQINTLKLAEDEIPEECINCILDDILSNREPNVKKFWLDLYKEGTMSLHCKLTGKKYVVNEEFFKKIK